VPDLRISPDGHKVAVLTGDALPNIWILDLEKGTRARFTFEANADGMAWSGDSRQLYYASRGKPYRILRQEVGGSGKKELVLESVKALSLAHGGKLQLTSNGAETSRWSGDGKAIYYETRDGSVFEMPVIESDDSLRPGALKLLFKASTLGATGFFGTAWDVTRDGQHFLVKTSGQQTDESVAVIALEWTARLKK
jgi:Tol biopolymer transport system component